MSKALYGVKKKTFVGSDVWIGTNAVILDGCRIGDGAIIAAGAIVTKDVEPYAIVGGVPAVSIRYRFEGKIRDELMKSCWWLKNEKELEFLSQYIDQPGQFVKECKNKLT